MQTEIEDKLRNSRVLVITSVIIAVAVNIIAVYVVNYPEISVIVVVVIFIITVLAVTYYSGSKTTISTDILARVLYDGRTGEITNYPDNVVQTLIRQTFNNISTADPQIKDSLVSFGKGSEYKDTPTFIEMAEVIVLSQISNLLSSMPAEYMGDFSESKSLPPEYLNNSIINAIQKTTFKDKRMADSMISSFESCWLPKNGSFTISRDAFDNSTQARLLTLQNRYTRIGVVYQISQNVYHPLVHHWLVHGTPFTEIGDIAINPIYQADALKRLKENELRSVSFSYNVKAEIRNPMLSLFVLMLGIPLLSKALKRSISFIEYFVENLHSTFFGSIDLRLSESYERERLERRFILESMTELRNSLGKVDSPLRDYSNDYIM
jgi:hypothetical protein